MPSPARQDFLDAEGLAWLRGDTIPAWTVDLDNDDGTPVDLTGAYIVMDIYNGIKGSLLARLRTSGAPAAPGGQPEGTITITSAANGQATVEQVPPTVTNALLPSKARRTRVWYTFEITWTTPTPDVVLTPFDGEIEMLPDGT